jgi:hypothetical protein
MSLMTSYLVIFMAIFSFPIGKQGVLFAEMERPPVLSVQSDHIGMTVTNSMQNSSKTIYKIDHERVGDSFFFQGYQRLIFGKIKHDYAFTFKDLGIAKVDGISFFWKDPDGRTTKLMF